MTDPAPARWPAEHRGRAPRTAEPITDPGLAHWLDEHRRQLAKLVYHLIYSLHVLPDHDQPALRGVLSEASAVRAAAGEAARHLAHTDLVGTRLAAQYEYLAGDLAAWWPSQYQEGGAAAVRQDTIGLLEDAMRELESPTPVAVPRHHTRDGVEAWRWLVATNHYVSGLLHQLREALARPPDVRDLLAAVGESLDGAVAHLAELADVDARGQLREDWLERAQHTYGVLAGQLHHPPLSEVFGTDAPLSAGTLAAIEDFGWLATRYLNELVRA